MYSISGYGSMIADRGRMDAYVKALRQAIKPDSVVLDLGTGTGIFALLACQFGAKKVYAIEPSDAIQVAKEIAKANGYADQIEFIQGLSTQVTLPELADLIISDLRGMLPLFQQHIPSIIDARKRLLTPDGILIPHRDELWATIVESSHLYGRIVNVWDDNKYQLDMTAARQIVINNWGKGWVTPGQILTVPKCWASLDYHTIESPNINVELDWTVTRNGTGHGLSIWFDAILVEGISFSTAPGMPELIYGNGFLPWLKPVFLATGDQVSVKLQANLVGDDYIWNWHTLILNDGDPKQIKAKFQQSTFLGIPLSPRQLGKTVANYVPTLNEHGQIDLLILQLMSNNISLENIAKEIAAKFPTHFPKWENALTRVGTISQKYT